MTTGTESAGMTPIGVGEILAGKYEVERVLGSGGMGVVVAAKHVHLGERVAIKFLLPQAIKKKEVVQRFVREARAAVRIKSEHVARVFDVGELESGAPYMVMEYLEGADLSTILKTKGAVPVETAVEYVLQACEAIAEAHSLKIIHRDLKPANLFVAKRADGSPVVKVIDFGISKVAEVEGDVEMTKTDVMMGSPVYMAPEQMISARDVDERADVWSLGVILHYLVMGAQPFRGQSVTQLYAAILEGPPSMRATRADVPEALDAAVMKCLNAHPKDRWMNVAEFANAISEFGPVRSRVSAERVSRTLGITPVTKSTPPPPMVTPGSITPPAVSSTEARGSEASTGPHTDGSWGGTQGPLQRRSRTPMIAIAALVIVGILSAGVVMIVRSSANAGSGAAPDPSVVGSGSPSISGTTLVTPATAVPIEPVVVPPSTATATATTAVTAAPTTTTATTATTATAKVVASGTAPRGTATARPTTTATVTKKGTDLFNDPH